MMFQWRKKSNASKIKLFSVKINIMEYLVQIFVQRQKED